MMRFSRALTVMFIAAGAFNMWWSPTFAVSFTSSYTDGGTWRTLFAQGFKPSINPSPNPGFTAATTVHLDRFQFFKSGATEYDTGGGVMAPIPAALDVQLAIFYSAGDAAHPTANGIFTNLATLTTSSPELAGLSTNTIADVATIATGDPITFNFNHIALPYGSSGSLGTNNFGAILVKKNPDNTLTPVRVPAIVVDYIDGQNEIESDYGQPGNYYLSGSNFMHTNSFGTYLDAFNATDSGLHGDGNFIAYFDLPAGLQGDYNGDSKVDALDYTVWRNNLGDGTEADINNNGNGTGGVDEGDFTLWKQQYGATSGPGGGGIAAPEPASVLLVVLGIGMLTGAVGRRRG